MIPIRDTIPSRRLPFVTWALIAANLTVFVWQLSLGPTLAREDALYAFVPAELFGHAPEPAGPVARFLPLLTSMFLHGGWFHLLGNMLYLFIFGDNVEDIFGRFRFLLFYLGCGVASALAQGLSNPCSKLPMVGASGAVAGILGAYFLLFPRARVLTLIPVLFFFPLVEVPAFFFLLFWFFLQFVQGARASAVAAPGGGVAWWAHVGGFTAGLVVALAVRIVRAARR